MVMSVCTHLRMVVRFGPPLRANQHLALLFSDIRIVLSGSFRYNFPIMFVKFGHHHRVRVMLGAPVMFLFFLSGNTLDSTANILSLDITPTTFPSSGESVTATLVLDARLSSNAVGGILTYDPTALEARAISLDKTVVDLWAGDPSFDNTNGTLRFDGGFIDANGYVGRGKILSVEFRVKSPGVTRIEITEPKILANDGVGTNRALETFTPFSRIFIHDATHPSIDQNGDEKLSLSDAQTVFFATFRAFDARRDITGDGRVSWADIAFLLTLIGE